MDISFARASISNPTARRGVLAFSIYLGLSLLVFGRPLLGHFHDSYIGVPPNPSLDICFMVWWPYALIHHLNPFYTHAFWAPVGLNMTWISSLPLLSIAMWPVIAAAGPVAAYNLLSLLGPPLAGWSAFLLCRYASKSWWPSLLGGYVFGFSAYMLSEQTSGDRHLTVIFLVPLAALAVARAICDREKWAAGRLVLILAAILTGQFLIFIEVFATMTMFGTIALFFGWLFAPPETARRAAKAALAVSCAYLVTAIIVSPYLYWMFAHGMPHGEIWRGAAEVFSGEAVKYAIPPVQTALGGMFPVRQLTSRWFPSVLYANSLYIGLPLLAIACAYAWDQRRTPLGRTLAISFVIVTLSALGAYPYIHGKQYVSPLGRAILALPLLGKALPGRFMAYSFLIMAVMAALWFASNGLGRKINAALAAIVIISTLPSISFSWAQPAVSPAFFTGGIYRNYLKLGENVLVFPFGHRGDSMLWLAQTNLYFRMVGGWTGPFPAEFVGWPALAAFSDATYLPDAGEQLGAFMAHFQVNAAVVADSDPEAKSWNALLSGYSSTTNHVGGVTVFRIDPVALKQYRAASKLQMRQRAASNAANSLIIAAGEWISSGHASAQLTALEALRYGLLKYSWCLGPKTQFFGGQSRPLITSGGRSFCGVGLGGTPDGRVTIGLFGSYSGLAPAIARYRGAARHIYFPYPDDLAAAGIPAPPADKWALMVMEFDRDRLIEIANRLRASRPN